MKHADRRVRKCAFDCLTQLHGSSIIKHWGPSSTVINNFWKISSQTILSIARQILDNRTSEDYLKSLLDLLSKILISRNTFLSSVMVKSSFFFLVYKAHEKIEYILLFYRILHMIIQKLMNVFKLVLPLKLRCWYHSVLQYLIFVQWQLNVLDTCVQKLNLQMKIA